MGVKKMTGKDGKTKWRADFYIRQPNGVLTRVMKTCPTKALVELFEKQAKLNAFEGEYFKRPHEKIQKTVADVWELYQAKSKRDNRSWQTDEGRAKHLVQHLGNKTAESLTEVDIDRYRDIRMTETTQRGGPPSSAQLDREVELLKRMLNYAARSQEIRHNPVGHVRLLRKPNTRDIVLTQAEFESVYEAAEAPLRPIILVAYETGMRLDEILSLKWERVDLKNRQFRLLAEELKEKKARVVLLTDRVIEALREIPRSIDGFVFINPETGTRWGDIRKAWARALRKAGIQKDVHFHDLRRSFATNARRRGIPESVVMRMTGHKTRSVFDRYNIVDEGDLEVAISTMERKRDAELSGQAEVAK